MKKLITIGSLGMALFPTTQVSAHGVVGNRFFPATINVEDPVISDELTLPQIQTFKERQEDGSTTRVTHNSFEASKRITRDFAVSVGGDYVHQEGVDDEKDANGFDNFELAAKYQLFKNAEHETIVSAGIDWDIGNTGSNQVGAENFSTYMPQLYFGKGFGDLPDSVDYLKPFAITGVVGVGFPSRRHAEGEVIPDVLHYGFTLQYSLPYLQQHVKDIGISAPFSKVIPIVEFAFEAPLNRVDDKDTTGTINPGFIVTGQKAQFGLEAVLPINNDSGNGVGVVAQVHFYLDDIFPTTIGKPLLGN